MKKTKIICSLLLGAQLMIGHTVFAADGSFAEVPQDHWAYGAVKDLANAGLLDGYVYQQNKPMSRYEMAILVEKLMQHYDKANVAQKTILDSLNIEFREDIKEISSLLTNLQANKTEKQKDKNEYPKFKIGGDIRFRYYSNLGLNGANNGADSIRTVQDRIRVVMGAQIDDRLSVNARIGAQSQHNRTDWGATTGNNGSSTGPVQMDQAEVNYKMDPNWTFTFGRSGMFLGTTGALADCTYWDGVTLKYSKDRFTGRLIAYDVSQALIAYLSATNVSNKVDSQNVKGVDLKYTLSPNVTMTADYIVSDDHTPVTNSSNVAYHSGLPWNVLAVGANVKLADDYTFKAEYVNNRDAYATTTTPAEGHGFYTGLNYKSVRLDQPGTYSLGIHYQEWGKDTINGMFMGGLTNNNTNYGAKGWGISYDYVVAKNCIANVICDWMTPYDTKTNDFRYNPSVTFVLLSMF